MRSCQPKVLAMPCVQILPQNRRYEVQMKELKTENDLEEIAGNDLVIIFKHSTQCPISANAHKEMEQFLRVHKNAPVYLVKVIESRPVSNAIAKMTNIQHESPQVIVLQRGKPVWHASHYDITAVEIEQALVHFQ